MFSAAAVKPAIEIIYPRYKHLTILLYLASFFQAGEPVMRDMAGFIRGWGYESVYCLPSD